MKKILILGFLVFVATVFLPGETLKLTIDRAIELAQENNTNFQISQQEVRQFGHRVRQNMGFLPQISLEGMRTIDEKLMEIEIPGMVPGAEAQRVTLDFTKNYEMTLQLVQPIYTGGKVWYSFKNAQIDYRLAKERLRNSRDELILNVKKSFYNIMVMKELLKTHNEALALAKRNLTNVSLSHDLGMVSKYDLLRAELEMARIHPRITNTVKLLTIMKNNFKVMLGIPENTDVEIDGEFTYERRSLMLSQLVEEALVRRSEILQLDMEKDKVDNLLKMTYAQFVPDISLVGSYSFRADDFKFNSGNWEDYYTVSMGISLPIFTGLKRSAQVGEMRVLRKIMTLRQKNLSDGTRTQVQNLVLDIQEQYENILLEEKNIETANEGVRVADLNYGEGLITILEVNASYNELTRAKVGYLEAVYKYNISLSELEKISGVRINGGES